MFKIEKDIPIPAMTRPGATPKYPFRQMEVGDSFSVPADADGFYTNRNGYRAHRVQTCMGHYRKDGLRFCSRMPPDGSCRVWRVE